MDIETARFAFAEELRYIAHAQSDRVIAAFATVPRHLFLGAPPWRILDWVSGYWDVPGDDPTVAYHNVLFAIDASRELNNGQPEFWARLLDRLDIRAGETVLHVGTGLGYYTAIFAELAGQAGCVIAAEIDPGLAERAAANLAGRSNVRVVAADGADFDPGPVDVIVVNAGATHPAPGWLASLKPAGRLLLPLTAGDHKGTVFLIERLPEPNRYAATAVSEVQIYACTGARTDPAARLLGRALRQGGQRFVRALRLDLHEASPCCWLHGAGFCLSTRSP